MRDAAIDTHRQAARAARSRPAEAPPLDDMVGEGPVSRGAPRAAPRGGASSAAIAAQRLGGGRISRARARPAPGLLARLGARMPRVRPLKVLTIGAFGVALVGIVANAMVFQRGPHPSPLFGLGRSVDGPAEATQRTAAAVPPPAAPAPVENTGAIAPPPAAPVAPAPLPAAAATRPAPIHREAKLHHEDAAKPARTAEGTAHPRPGHPVPAHARAEGRPDPVAKLLAEAGHPAKPDAKVPAAKATAKPHAKPVADAASHPHHRVATAAGDAKPAARTE